MNTQYPDTDDTQSDPRRIDNNPISLPFRFWWPALVGVLCGIVMRVLFGLPGTYESPLDGTSFKQPVLEVMGVSFLFLAPIFVGAVTVYVAEKQARRSWLYYLLMPAIANMLFVAGTMLIMIEGLICALLILPMFGVIGALAGVIMGALCRYTNWPKQTVYSLALLPFLMNPIEQQLPLPIKINAVEHSIYIDAPAENVWKNIMSASAIQAHEVQDAWMYRIGVPLPESGILKQTSKGLVREIKMGKDIHFEQVVTQWQPNRYAQMRYHFSADSVPARALDDHVKIGGKYFDLGNTSYTLTPTGKGTTLNIRMEYRVSTQFNWYAEPIAQQLMSNFEEVILGFYKQRSEAK
jgi:hypothetical protein